MVSLTLSIPEELKKKMEQFPEINWSGLVRKVLVEKAQELQWRKETLLKLKQEDASGFTQWTIDSGRKVNKGITERLKKEGLL
jgi:hypothetical protein